MTPQHAEIYRKLDRDETHHLWSTLHSRGVVAEPPPTVAQPEELVSTIGELSHAEVVLSLARDTSETGMRTVEKLIERPIYLCARGETGEELTDIHGRPLRTPLGHRRGESPGTSSPPPPIRARMRARTVRRDNRVISYVAERNPKRPGSATHERFKLYEVGITVETAIARGVTRSDVSWDARQGFIRLDRAPREEAES
jgi:hypothetical protein